MGSPDPVQALLAALNSGKSWAMLIASSPASGPGPAKPRWSLMHALLARTGSPGARPSVRLGSLPVSYAPQLFCAALSRLASAAHGGAPAACGRLPPAPLPSRMHAIVIGLSRPLGPEGTATWHQALDHLCEMFELYRIGVSGQQYAAVAFNFGVEATSPPTSPSASAGRSSRTSSSTDEPAHHHHQRSSPWPGPPSPRPSHVSTKSAFEFAKAALLASQKVFAPLDSSALLLLPSVRVGMHSEGKAAV
jgi:hypothetical protein